MAECFWEKSYTYPSGTPEYFSDEMKEIFFKSDDKPIKGYVNLYLNDIYALNLTIVKLNEIHERMNPREIFSSEFSQ